MKLLILTQTVDLRDPTLGFFIDWIKEFSKKAEKITVICLKKGEFELPENVTVLSLGKTTRKITGLSKLKYIFNFYKFILSNSKEYDTVFVHMNPEYVCLGGLIWKIFRKKIYLWYVHRAVNLKLRVAEKFVSKIFTASSSSFKLKSRKIEVVGHGILISFFSLKDDYNFTEPIKILTVSRITPIKRLESVILTCAILRDKFDISSVVKIVGDVVDGKDNKYKQKLLEIITQNNLKEKITFSGSLNKEELYSEYFLADLFVNFSPEGGLDKVVMEAMASGLITFVSNVGFSEYLDDLSNDLIVKTPDDLAEKINNLYHNFNYKDKENLGLDLRRISEEKFDLPVLIEKLKQGMQ